MQQRAERRDGGAEEEAAGAEVKVDRVPGDVRDEAEAERREREPRTLDHLPGDQADENGRAERRDAGDHLQQEVAEVEPAAP